MADRPGGSERASGAPGLTRLRGVQLVAGHLVADAANVVGSRPDGWWRDRAGAATRLAARLVAALDGGGLATLVSPDGVVHLVLEGAARTAAIPEHPRLRVHRAEHDGDSAIAALAAELTGPVTVVTADRGLRERVQACGATTVGPGTLLGLLHS
ncbi:hypothetical protein [Pseudonocardia sp. GCM10023141]|uniref:hypothetical protein n=1 Tax=Pseudonocardia sp. GCM10023141 TaxID=3252653 RepID=UPI0036102FA2